MPRIPYAQGRANQPQALERVVRRVHAQLSGSGTHPPTAASTDLTGAADVADVAGAAELRGVAGAADLGGVAGAADLAGDAGLGGFAGFADLAGLASSTSSAGTGVAGGAGGAVTGGAGDTGTGDASDASDAVTGGAATGGARPAFVGVGASFAALALPTEILCAAGVPARRELASELRATDADLLLGVSQSGRSPETIDALGLVPRSRRAAVVNVLPSLLGESVDRLIDLGDEDDSYASTIGYTGTQVALTMIARTMLGWTADEAAAEWAGISPTLTAYEAAVAGPIDEVAALARTVVAADFVASGAARSATESGALLLREVCRVPSAALVTRNYLHGEMESAGATLHVIVGEDRELELARSLARAGHLTLIVTSAALAPEENLHVVPVPGDLPLPVRTVLQTAVVQRLAGSLASARGVDIEEFVFHNSDTKLEEPVG